MPSLREILLNTARGEAGFEADLDASHVGRLPPELKIFERNFRLTPVEHDPFPKPEPKTKKKDSR
jgi:hypothetical protein